MRTYTAVLRNRVTRKDAAYIVTIEEEQGKYQVEAFWGPWAKYLQEPKHLTQLQHKNVFWGWDYSVALGHADSVVSEKMARGYVQVGQVQETAPEPKPKPEPKPEPKTLEEKWGKDSLVSRLKARSG